MNKYLIFADEYKRNSGGNKALHKLAELLFEKGFSVRIGKNLIADENEIVVYPERVSGNPCNGKNIVRWMLHKKDYFDKEPRVYNENETTFWISKILNKDGNILPINTIELELFKDDGLVRDKVLLYEGKGKATDEFKTALKDYIEITKDYPKDRKELAQLFKTAKVLYCFDSMTCVTSEARLCGCPVVQYLNGDFKKEDYEMTAGIAWDNSASELEKAENELYLYYFYNQYSNYLLECEKGLNNFINITQKL